MEETLLEVAIVAQRLSLDSSTVRRMFHAGILKGFLTGASLKRIRIYESSVTQHMKGDSCRQSNTGTTYV
jgi:predicted site-specific integrase-resolvase